MALELGPVVRFESRRVVRRRGWYVLRVVFALAILGILGLCHWAFLDNVRHGAQPEFTKRFLAQPLVGFLVTLHLLIAFLIAPIEAASGFSRVRVRPMFSILLTTQMSARCIVWETFAACLIPAIWLWLCLVPLAAIVISWWGVNPELIAIIELVTLGSILVSVAATVAVSLWSKHVFTALVGIYGFWCAWLLASGFLFEWLSLPSWAARANPYLLLVRQTTGTGPPTLFDAIVFAGGAALVSVVLLEITVAAFRWVVLKPVRPRSLTMTRFARHHRLAFASPRWLPAPSLDDNPVLWREWWRARTSLGAKLFWLLYFVIAGVATISCVHAFWQGQRTPDLVGVVGYEIGIGLLAVCLRSSLAWSDEKTAGHEGLDLLLATPLSATTIVMGKWWAAYRDIVPIVFLPVVSAVILAQGAETLSAVPGSLSAFVRVAVVAVIVGQVLLYGAAFVGLGLLLATRFARPAKAAFAMVGLFVGITLFLPTVAEMAFLNSHRGLASGLGAGSPIAGPIAALMTLFFSPYFARWEYLLPFAFGWLAVAGCFAWGLNWWTIHRFDRWMGRMSATAGESSLHKPPNDRGQSRGP